MHMKSSFKYLLILFMPIVYGESIVIDANLNEPEWDNAITINEYKEVIPFTLTPAEVKTETEAI